MANLGLQGNTSVACIASTDAGASWQVRGQLPLPLPSPVNEVAIGLTPNGSVYASYRSDTRVKTRYRSCTAALTSFWAISRAFPAPTHPMLSVCSGLFIACADWELIGAWNPVL